MLQMHTSCSHAMIIESQLPRRGGLPLLAPAGRDRGLRAAATLVPAVVLAVVRFKPVESVHVLRIKLGSCDFWVEVVQHVLLVHGPWIVPDDGVHHSNEAQPGSRSEQSRRRRKGWEAASARTENRNRNRVLYR